MTLTAVSPQGVQVQGNENNTNNKGKENTAPEALAQAAMAAWVPGHRAARARQAPEPQREGPEQSKGLRHPTPCATTVKQEAILPSSLDHSLG